MSLVSNVSDVITAIGVAIKGKQDKSVAKTLISDLSITSTSLVDISGLTYNLKANTTYQITAYIPFIKGVSGAVCKIGYSSPTDSLTMLEVLTPIGNINMSVFDYYSYIYSSGDILSQASAGYTLITNGENNPCVIKGIIKTNSAGTFTLKGASEDGTNVILKAGATLLILPI